MSSLNLPWCSFEPFPHVPSLDMGEKRSAPPSPLLLEEAIERSGEVTLQPPFLQTRPVLSCPSQDMPSSSFTSFVALLSGCIQGLSHPS